MKKVTYKTLENLKPKEKPYRINVAERLFLEIRPTGKKFWSLRYTYNGSQKTKSLGEFPVISISEAKKKAEKEYELATQGFSTKSEKFDEIFIEWLEDKKIRVKEKTVLRDKRIYDKYLKSHIGNLQIDKITPAIMLNALKNIEKQNITATLDKAVFLLRGVFNYACAYEKLNYNPVDVVRTRLSPSKQQNHPHIQMPQDLKLFLEGLNNYTGNPITKLAIKFQILTFVRPGNIRFCEWKEIDFKNSLWIIPKEKMKTGFSHVVPLSKQSIKILEQIKIITGDDKYVFNYPNKNDKPLSEGTLIKAVRTIALNTVGYKIVPHGFRHTASTFLNEMGFNQMYIEKQLAHKDTNKVRGIYNKAEYLTQRTFMMQFWADYLDELIKAEKAFIKQLNINYM